VTNRRETLRERLKTHTHIVVRGDATGRCEFLNDTTKRGGGWTKQQYLAIPYTEEKAVEIAERFQGMAILAPPIDPPARQYKEESEA